MKKKDLIQCRLDEMPLSYKNEILKTAAELRGTIRKGGAQMSINAALEAIYQVSRLMHEKNCCEVKEMTYTMKSPDAVTRLICVDGSAERLKLIRQGNFVSVYDESDIWLFSIHMNGSGIVAIKKNLRTIHANWVSDAQKFNVLAAAVNSARLSLLRAMQYENTRYK